MHAGQHCPGGTPSPWPNGHSGPAIGGHGPVPHGMQAGQHRPGPGGSCRSGGQSSGGHFKSGSQPSAPLPSVEPGSPKAPPGPPGWEAVPPGATLASVREPLLPPGTLVLALETLASACAPPRPSTGARLVPIVLPEHAPSAKTNIELQTISPLRTLVASVCR